MLSLLLTTSGKHGAIAIATDLNLGLSASVLLRKKQYRCKDILHLDATATILTPSNHYYIGASCTHTKTLTAHTYGL